MILDQFNNLSEEIEKIVRTLNVNHIDAILHWCEKNNIEAEVIGKIIKKNKILMAKLSMDAEGLNLIPKTDHLPL